MRSRFALLAALAVLVVPAPSPVLAQSFFFKDGDRVVVMGDSITEQRLYSNYLELWTVTRFPAWDIAFRNVGIGGDRSPGGNARFQRDVLAYKPTALTIDFGMNDGSYTKFSPRTFDPYMKGLQGIADKAKAAGIRVAWITPQPTERRDSGKQLAGYNETLEKFSEGVKTIAEKNDGLFVDQFHPYLAVIDKARQSDPKILVTGGDAVHPGPPGQALMAASILKAMHFPSVVSSVSLDLNGDAAPVAKQCKVTDVQTEHGVKFTRLDRALPYFPKAAKGILKWTPLLEEMNEYGLQVRGLKAGQYAVKLGGKEIATHTADELAKGVNLAAAALEAGPIAEQVQAVTKAVDAKTNYFHDKIFRGLILANAKSADFKGVEPKDINAKRRELFEERMQKMPALDAAIRQALVMRPYTVEIVPATTKK